MLFLNGQKLHNNIEVLGLMWKCTIRTLLDFFAIYLDVFIIAWAVLSSIQRAIAKQAIDMVTIFVTWVIFTF